MPLLDMTNSETCLLSMLANASCELIDREAKRARTTPTPQAGKYQYLCKQCGRGYANTDAARKHARQNHPEWLREQGVGSPSLYCTAIETEAVSPPKPVALVVTPPAAVTTAETVKPLPITPTAAAMPPPPPSPAAATATAHLLMFAHTKFEVHTTDELEDTDDEMEKHVSRVDPLAALLAITPAPATVCASGSSGNKRPRAPRTVRCGKCEGCERDDCGTCKNCVDKPKFGGLGQRKQGCVRKTCISRMPAAP